MSMLHNPMMSQMSLHQSMRQVGCPSYGIPVGQARTAGVIASIKFNQDGTFSNEKNGNMSYPAISPSALILNGIQERLFVCGGWWNNHILKNVEIHHFVTGTVTKLKSMIHRHQSPGISQWDRYTAKIFVAGGYDR